MGQSDRPRRRARQVARAYNSFTDNLHESIESVIGTADALSKASNEIAAAAQSLTQTTSEHAAAVQETTASLEEMNASINQNAANSRQMEQMALEGAHELAQCSQVVGESVARDENYRRENYHRRGDRLPDQSFGPQRRHRSGARRRAWQRLRRGRQRSQKAWPNEASSRPATSARLHLRASASRNVQETP